MKAYFFFGFISLTITSFSDLIDKNGKGYLESKNEQVILHVEGSSYERGYQHGTLLKEKVLKNIDRFITPLDHPNSPERVKEFLKNIPTLLSYTPSHIKEEMQGLADAVEVSVEKVYALNLFPELFHCSAIAILPEAAAQNELLHVRVLDYGVGKGLQDTSVLCICRPDNKHAYLSVTYAGFIGCITGMNEQKIALGEMGGSGYGSCNGLPMAFIMKEVLENASSLEEAKKMFTDLPRTCEYYYLVSDGNSKEALGIYATNSQIHFIEPGANYALLAPKNIPSEYGKDGLNGKFFLPDFELVSCPHRTTLLDQNKNPIGNFFSQLDGTIVMTGFNRPERFDYLLDDLESSYGNVDASILMKMLNENSTHTSNLHNAIFLPESLEVYICHAGKNNEPAFTQEYHFFSLVELLQK